MPPVSSTLHTEVDLDAVWERDGGSDSERGTSRELQYGNCIRKSLKFCLIKMSIQLLPKFKLLNST